MCFNLPSFKDLFYVISKRFYYDECVFNALKMTIILLNNIHKHDWIS